MSKLFYTGPGACLEGAAYFWHLFSGDRSMPSSISLSGREDLDEGKAKGLPSNSIEGTGLAYVLCKALDAQAGAAGCNERGLAVGLLLRRSRFSASRKSLPDLELLQLVLGNATSPKEGVELIIKQLESMGQAGAYRREARRGGDSAYLLANKEAAILVETAGKRWAWREHVGIVALSEGYSIDEDYKRLDPQTRKEIAPVNERAACSDEADAGRKGQKESWKAHVQGRQIRGLRQAEQGAALAQSTLEAGRGSISLDTLFALMTSTSQNSFMTPPSGAELYLHSRLSSGIGAELGSIGVQYLGSETALLWLADSPIPELAIYRPILLAGGVFSPLWTIPDSREGNPPPKTHWQPFRTWTMNRQLKARISNGELTAHRNKLQARVVKSALAAAKGMDIDTARAEIDAAIGGS